MHAHVPYRAADFSSASELQQQELLRDMRDANDLLQGSADNFDAGETRWWRAARPGAVGGSGRRGRGLVDVWCGVFPHWQRIWMRVHGSCVLTLYGVVCPPTGRGPG